MSVVEPSTNSLRAPRSMTMRQKRVEHFVQGRRVLFLSTIALTMMTSFQQSLSSECDSRCFSVAQATKALLSLLMAVLFGLTSDFIKPEEMLVVVAVVNLLVNIIAMSAAGNVMAIALTIYSSSSMNQSFMLLRSLYSQMWSKDSSNAEKSTLFGKLGATMSLTCVLGPLVGAYMFSSRQNALYASSILLLVNVLVASQLIQSSQSIREYTNKDATAITGGISPACSSWQSLRISLISPQVLLLLALKFCMAFSYGLFLPVWRQILLNTYNFSAQSYSLHLVVTSVAYAFCLRFVSSKVISVAGLGQDYLLVVCVVILSLGRIVIVQTSSLLVVSAAMFSLMGALAITNTLLSVACTNISEQAHIGSVYGLMDFSESLAGIISSLMAANKLMASNVYHPLAGVCVSYMCFSCLVLWYFKLCFSGVSEVVSTSVPVEKLVKGKKHRRQKSPTSVAIVRDEAMAATGLENNVLYAQHDKVKSE